MQIYATRERFKSFDELESIALSSNGCQGESAANMRRLTSHTQSMVVGEDAQAKTRPLTIPRWAQQQGLVKGAAVHVR